MPTIKLKVRGKTNPSPVYLRFINGRAIDIPCKTPILLNPAHWDVEKQRIKNVIEVKNRDELNSKIVKLKAHLFEEFNNDFLSGEIIDSEWINKKVNEFFKRPKNEVKKVIEKHHLYYTDFTKWWLQNKAATYKTAKGTYISSKSINQYGSFYEIVLKYETIRSKKLKLVNISEEVIQDFISFMQNEEKYAYNTIKRHFNRFTFFLRRAEGSNISVNQNYKEKFFIAKNQEDIMEPILTEEEIELIFNKDFSFDDHLDNIRDNFIIGLRTGLRISDFNNNLTDKHLSGDYIEIVTSKTGAMINIPIHPMVHTILKKRHGLLPQKFSDQEFNRQVKIICQLCNIDEVIPGKVTKILEGNIKRDIPGYYEKYKLVSSHICRRSFATNLYGKVPNSVIQHVGGWATETMMLHYIKKSKRDYAEALNIQYNK